MDYEGIENIDPSQMQQMEDEMYIAAVATGHKGAEIWDNARNTFIDVIEQYDNDSEFKFYDGSDQLDVVKSVIDSGKPAIVNIGGHFTVATGYDDNGLILHDPYGNKNNNPWADSDGVMFIMGTISGKLEKNG